MSEVIEQMNQFAYSYVKLLTIICNQLELDIKTA